MALLGKKKFMGREVVVGINPNFILCNFKHHKPKKGDKK
jgi:hypothetical protein